MTNQPNVNVALSSEQNKSAPNLVFRYGSVYVLLFTLGLVGYYILDVPFSERLNGCITSYFSSVFDRTTGIGENLSLLFSASRNDIRTMGLLFLSGFTMFSSLAIYGLLGFHAASLGFSAAYLVGALSAGELTGVRFSDLVFYLFGRAAVCAVFILFSARTREFCEQFRRLSANPKRVLHFKGLYLQIISLLCSVGVILTVNLFRMVMNALFLKGL